MMSVRAEEKHVTDQAPASCKGTAVSQRWMCILPSPLLRRPWDCESKKSEEPVATLEGNRKLEAAVLERDRPRVSSGCSYCYNSRANGTRTGDGTTGPHLRRGCLGCCALPCVSKATKYERASAACGSRPLKPQKSLATTRRTTR